MSNDTDPANDTIPHVDAKVLVGLGTSSTANESLYDNWAPAYEQDVMSWGYTLPHDGAKLLKSQANNIDDNSHLRILDAGAGDGLTGMALRTTAQFTGAYIVGSDVSQKMLAKAKDRGCYNDTIVLDLNQPLTDVASNSYDIIQCLGTLTYVDPKAGTLAEFIRICKKPGGLICFSHRTDKEELWTRVQESLVKDHKWTLVNNPQPLPYLPGNPEYADNVQVKLFLYKVL
jgi:predicted TPR repeat methyltransferase